MKYAYEQLKQAEDGDLEALYWLEKAAGQGVVSAQHNLGEIYSFSQCVDESYEEAASEWSRKAEGDS